LFIALSLSAQRVHYKDNYYTLVNSKIFHLGHNVYGKLTQGERDTLYLIARELYNDIGKLKPHYKNRRKRDRYKLPEGFWDKKNSTAAVQKTALVSTSSALAVTGETVQKEKSILATTNAERKNEKKEKDVIEKEDKFEKQKEEKKDQLKEEKKQKTQQQKKQQSNKENRIESNQEKAAQKSKEAEKSSKKEQIEKDKERREKLMKEQKVEERSAFKDEKKEEKKLKKEEEKLQKAEKEQKKKEKEIKAKEKAIKSTKEAKKKLKNTQEKYKKLKDRGELSPNDEAEWLEKIEKLKEKLVKTERKVG
jgi:hypothetical protein